MYRRNFAGPWAGYDHGERICRLECVNATPRLRHHPVQAAHVIRRGMGSVKGCWMDLVPLCAHCHREFDEQFANDPGAYQKYAGHDLRSLADQLAAVAILRQRCDCDRCAGAGALGSGFGSLEAHAGSLCVTCEALRWFFERRGRAAFADQVSALAIAMARRMMG